MNNTTIIHALRTKANECSLIAHDEGLMEFIAWSLTCREDMPTLYRNLFGPAIGSDFTKIYILLRKG